MTSQKSDLRNYLIGWHLQKEQDEKSRLAKNQPVNAHFSFNIVQMC